MILSCPACGIRFKVDPSVLGPAGRQVRCGKCSHQWFQEPKAEEPPAPPREARAEPEVAAAALPPPLTSSDGGGEGMARLEAFDQAKRRADAEREMPPKPRRRAARLAAAWLFLLVFVGAVGAALWFGRATIVAQVPEAADLYRLVGIELGPSSSLGEGLELRDVSSSKRVVDGQTTLLIEGSVVNISDRAQPVPALRAIITDAEGVEVSQWTFTTEHGDLPPGEQTTFQTSTANPVRGVSLNLIFVENDT